MIFPRIASNTIQKKPKRDNQTSSLSLGHLAKISQGSIYTFQEILRKERLWQYRQIITATLLSKQKVVSNFANLNIIGSNYVIPQRFKIKKKNKKIIENPYSIYKSRQYLGPFLQILFNTLEIAPFELEHLVSRSSERMFWVVPNFSIFRLIARDSSIFPGLLGECSGQWYISTIIPANNLGIRIFPHLLGESTRQWYISQSSH